MARTRVQLGWRSHDNHHTCFTFNKLQSSAVTMWRPLRDLRSPLKSATAASSNSTSEAFGKGFVDGRGIDSDGRMKHVVRAAIKGIGRWTWAVGNARTVAHAKACPESHVLLAIVLPTSKQHVRERSACCAARIDDRGT